MRLTIGYNIGMISQLTIFNQKYYPMVGDIPIESHKRNQEYELVGKGLLRFITFNYDVNFELKHGKLFLACITFFQTKYFKNKHLELIDQLDNVFDDLEIHFHGCIDYKMQKIIQLHQKKIYLTYYENWSRK